MYEYMINLEWEQNIQFTLEPGQKIHNKFASDMWDEKSTARELKARLNGFTPFSPVNITDAVNGATNTSDKENAVLWAFFKVETDTPDGQKVISDVLFEMFTSAGVQYTSVCPKIKVSLRVLKDAS
jgi:hypothetical protein